jgi:hypothetical protein
MFRFGTILFITFVQATVITCSMSGVRYVNADVAAQIDKELMDLSIQGYILDLATNNSLNWRD